MARVIEAVEQAEVISAVDLRAEAVAAVQRGDAPSYARNLAKYVEVLCVGDRAGVCEGADSVWGDVMLGENAGLPADHQYAAEQVVVLDDSGVVYSVEDAVEITA